MHSHNFIVREPPRLIVYPVCLNTQLSVTRGCDPGTRSNRRRLIQGQAHDSQQTLTAAPISIHHPNPKPRRREPSTSCLKSSKISSRATITRLAASKAKPRSRQISTPATHTTARRHRNNTVLTLRKSTKHLQNHHQAMDRQVQVTPRRRARRRRSSPNSQPRAGTRRRTMIGP